MSFQFRSIYSRYYIHNYVLSRSKSLIRQSCGTRCERVQIYINSVELGDTLTLVMLLAFQINRRLLCTANVRLWTFICLYFVTINAVNTISIYVVETTVNKDRHLMFNRLFIQSAKFIQIDQILRNCGRWTILCNNTYILYRLYMRCIFVYLYVYVNP